MEESGVRLVVENAAQSFRDLMRFDKLMASVDGTVKKASKSITTSTRSIASGVQSGFSGALSKGFNGFSGLLDSALSKVQRVSPQFGKGLADSLQKVGGNLFKTIPGLEAFTGSISAAGAGAASSQAAIGAMAVSIGAVAAAAVAAAAVVAALTVGFVALGKRGIAVETTAMAFSNSVSGFGDATAILKGLREETRGTVADVDLMRLSVSALQGTSQEFRGTLLETIDGQNQLGKVFDVTSRAARASGKSQEEVLTKFLGGLRLQSKLRLDDIGVVVEADKAYARYTDTLREQGLAISELTEDQKKIAFVQEALRQLETISVESGINKFSDILPRLQATFTNFIDRISVAILPAFKPFLLILDGIISQFEKLYSTVLPLVQSGAQLAGAVITGGFQIAGAVINATIGPLLRLAGQVFPYIVAAAQLAVDALRSLVSFIASGIAGAFNQVAAIRDAIFGRILGDTQIDLLSAAQTLARGGGNIIGSFAAGMARGATAVVNVVTKIAQIVADFLQGFSPPKRGPLSNIDSGGYNVAKAWADGFAGGILPTIESVTDDINYRLGDIASLSARDVEARLSQLDSALLPFQQQLAVVKADFEAISGGADKALEAIQRQQAKLGVVDSKAEVDKLLKLDAEAELIKNIRDEQQSLVDEAEIQLQLMQAQQAQERALLAIQAQRVGIAKDISAAAGGGGDGSEKAAGAPKEDKPEKGSGGEGAGAGGTPFSAGGGAPVDLISNESVTRARQQILSVAGAFGEGFTSATEGAFGDFDVARGGLDAQLARIKSAKPIDDIKKKFEGLAEVFTQPLADIKTKFDETFGANGTIATAVTGLLDGGLFGADGKIVTAIKDILGIDLSGDELKTSIETAVSSAFSGAAATILGTEQTGIKDAVSASLKGAFNFPEDVATSLATKIQGIVKTGFATGELLVAGLTSDSTITNIKDEIAGIIKNLPKNMAGLESAADSLGYTVRDKVKEGLALAKERVTALLTDSTFTDVKDEIKNITKGLFEDLQNIDINIDSLLQPVKDLMTGFNDAFGLLDFDLFDKAKGFLGDLAGTLGVENLFGDSGVEDAKAAISSLSSELVGQGIELQFTLPPGLSLSEEQMEALRGLGRSFNTYIVEGMIGEEGLALFNEGFTTLLTTAGENATTFADTIKTAFEDIKSSFDKTFIATDSPMQMLMITMASIFDAALAKFQSFVGGFTSAAATFGAAVSSAMTTPAQSALNGMLRAVIETINGAVRAANKILGRVGAGFPTVDYEPISIPGAATGAKNIRGTFLAGEEGPELITTTRPSTVFPARATRAIENMSGRAIPMPSNNTTNNMSNRTTNMGGITINVGNERQALLLQRELMADLL